MANCALCFRRLATRRMQLAPISTPCIKACAVSGQSGLCVGCGRTLREIARWATMEEAERAAIMAELSNRLARSAR